MITQPMSVYPNNNALDGTLNNTFEMEIKTSGDTVIAYQIKIYKINTDTVIYNGNKTNTVKYNGDFLQANIPANSFANGQDYSWRATLFVQNPNMLVANGVTQESTSGTSIKIRQHSAVENGMYLKIGNETRQITSYTLDTGIAIVASAFSTTPATGTSYSVLTNYIYTPFYPFKGRSAPVVNITSPVNDGQIITSFDFEFTGTYSQAQDILIKYFIFNIYNSSNVLINTSGQIYSNNIRYFIEELSNDETTNPYTVELIINNQDDIITSVSKKFSIQYVPLEIQFPPTVHYDENIAAAVVEWQQQLQSFGIVEGAVSYEKNAFNNFNSVVLNNSTTVRYEQINNKAMNLSEKSTILFSTVLSSDKQGKILEITLSNGDLIFITLEGFVFYINRKSGSKVFKKDIYNVFGSSLSCFQKSPVVDEGAGYYLYEKDLWPADTDNFYFLVNSLDVLANKHFKISLIPENITEKNYDKGIYFNNVADLDELGD